MIKLQIGTTKAEIGRFAAKKAEEVLHNVLDSKPKAQFVAATGASQFEFLDYLCKSGGIEWSRTEMFHLDEYIGIPITHPASFRRYLKDRLVDQVHPGIINFIKGDASDPEVEIKRLNDLISEKVIDIAFIGIGENGHIAFNDPPADFETEQPYLIVELNEECRNQQVDEGWFRSIEEVPRKAISMSVKQIMKAECVICICPERRKAEAVRDCLSKDAPITPMHPASILKKHKNVHIFLDKESASLLEQ